jgi:hypothetical protein
MSNTIQMFLQPESGAVLAEHAYASIVGADFPDQVTGTVLSLECYVYNFHQQQPIVIPYILIVQYYHFTY